jgi:hypothetical protein
MHQCAGAMKLSGMSIDFRERNMPFLKQKNTCGKLSKTAVFNL